ncbi:MAG TPA: YoaK family protein [Xanthobacteraceae bacterium]|nr:YoaK family protein [Xanthobacteraceae bacterium]
MTEMMAQRDDPPVPLLMPVLLSLVAGYLDSYTYLSLFGLFAAQVTGSFVIAGAEFVTSDFGIAGKLIAIAAFLTAAAATAAFCIAARDAHRAALPWMLGLETLLLATFVGIMVFGPAVHDARDWHGIVAGVFAAMAMGAQSVAVRLLMKDIPQTNVMTGNMTQLGIAVTELIMARRRFDHSRHGDTAVRDFDNARRRLVTVLAIALGFLAGVAAGALAFATTGLHGAVAAVAIVGTLALWALVRQERD